MEMQMNIRFKKCGISNRPNVHLHFHMKSPSVFLIILLISAKHDMLIAAISFY